MTDMEKVLCAAEFAALAHAKQTRKATGLPYIIHPLGVAHILAEVGIADPITLQAALLHDVLEDTPTSRDVLEKKFGAEVLSVVDEVTDDKSLTKAERKRLQIQHARSMSERARCVKLADKIHNLSSLIDLPPDDWDVQRVQGYFVWARKVVAAMPPTNQKLEIKFNFLMAKQFKLGGERHWCIPNGIDPDAFLERYLASFGDKK